MIVYIVWTQMAWEKTPRIGTVCATKEKAWELVQKERLSRTPDVFYQITENEVLA